MASLPNAFAPGPSSNTASKTKIGNDVTKEAQPVQGTVNDDDAALMKDATSWPEYRFKDSDFSNYHVQEVVNNGPTSDQAGYEQPDGAYWQDEYGDDANTKPRLGRPAEKPASPASQAQRQDDQAINGSPVAPDGKPGAVGSSPYVAATAGQVANNSKGEASISAGKQNASPQPNSSADSPAVHEALGSAGKADADTSTAGTQDKPGSMERIQTKNVEAQGLKHPTDTSKSITKVLSGLVEGSVQNTKTGPAEVHRQPEGAAEHVAAQADGASSAAAQATPAKDATPGANRPRSDTKGP